MSFLERLARKKMTLPSPEQALPGRTTRMPITEPHHVFGTPLDQPFEGLSRAMFALGCFWGAERMFWEIPGVISTAVGYAAGLTPNPTYEEVCSGLTGHTEVVRVIFDQKKVSYADLLKAFWENHDPTQGMRQGNDVGTQYRSGIYTYGADQTAEATASRAGYAERLRVAGHGDISTEILDAPEFYFAETYHQQYLSKNPDGYCGLAGTGVSCPIGVLKAG